MADQPLFTGALCTSRMGAEFEAFEKMLELSRKDGGPILSYPVCLLRSGLAMQLSIALTLAFSTSPLSRKPVPSSK